MNPRLITIVIALTIATTCACQEIRQYHQLFSGELPRAVGEVRLEIPPVDSLVEVSRRDGAFYANLSTYLDNEMLQYKVLVSQVFMKTLRKCRDSLETDRSAPFRMCERYSQLALLMLEGNGGDTYQRYYYVDTPEWFYRFITTEELIDCLDAGDGKDSMKVDVPKDYVKVEHGWVDEVFLLPGAYTRYDSTYFWTPPDTTYLLTQNSSYLQSWSHPAPRYIALADTFEPIVYLQAGYGDIAATSIEDESEVFADVFNQVTAISLPTEPDTLYVYTQPVHNHQDYPPPDPKKTRLTPIWVLWSSVVAVIGALMVI